MACPSKFDSARAQAVDTQSPIFFVFFQLFLPRLQLSGKEVPAGPYSHHTRCIKGPAPHALRIRVRLI